MLTAKKEDLLRDVPLFSACTRKELSLISKLADRVEIGAGDVLTQEGSPGREFFVIAEGTAAVDVRGKVVAKLGPGDFFGEMALLDLGPRAATVRAESPMTVYVIEQRDFGRLLDDVPVVARKILAGLAARLRQVQGAPAYAWNLPENRWNRR